MVMLYNAIYIYYPLMMLTTIDNPLVNNIQLVLVMGYNIH